MALANATVVTIASAMVTIACTISTVTSTIVTIAGTVSTIARAFRSEVSGNSDQIVKLRCLYDLTYLPPQSGKKRTSVVRGF